MIVRVPNVFDRAVEAIRAALAHRAARVAKSGTAISSSAAVAK